MANKYGVDSDKMLDDLYNLKDEVAEEAWFEFPTPIEINYEDNIALKRMFRAAVLKAVDLQSR